MVQLLAAVDERDARSVTPQIEGRDSGGILASDHQHIAVVIRMRLAIIMRDLGEIFAGQTELIGEVVVSSGDDYFTSAIIARTTGTVRGRDAELPVLAHHCFDPFVLTNIQMIVF